MGKTPKTYSDTGFKKNFGRQYFAVMKLKGSSYYRNCFFLGTFFGFVLAMMFNCSTDEANETYSNIKEKWIKNEKPKHKKQRWHEKYEYAKDANPKTSVTQDAKTKELKKAEVSPKKSHTWGAIPKTNLQQNEKSNRMSTTEGFDKTKHTTDQ